MPQRLSDSGLWTDLQWISMRSMSVSQIVSMFLGELPGAVARQQPRSELHRNLVISRNAPRESIWLTDKGIGIRLSFASCTDHKCKPTSTRCTGMWNACIAAPLSASKALQAQRVVVVFVAVVEALPWIQFWVSRCKSKSYTASKAHRSWGHPGPHPGQKH